MAINGATFAFRRRAMGITKKEAARRLEVPKDVVVDWEAGRVRVPADVSSTVENWWSAFVNRVAIAVEGTMDMIEEHGLEGFEGAVLTAYRTPEAHAAAEGDGETLFEHSAVVEAIMIALAAQGVQAKIEWRRGNG